MVRQQKIKRRERGRDRGRQRDRDRQTETDRQTDGGGGEHVLTAPGLKRDILIIEGTRQNKYTNNFWIRGALRHGR